MAFSLNGVHTPHRKNTQNKATIRMPLPDTVTIPMSMHIGAPAMPIVSKGDKVTVGQKIAEAREGLSVAIHCSIDGVVDKVTEREIIIKAK